uniref:Uncharacterized protein n=1 Tax=Caenorhabditis japonica TaxID=281687 RepID=A0A8R1IAZ6_CAEJA
MQHYQESYLPLAFRRENTFEDDSIDTHILILNSKIVHFNIPKWPFSKLTKSDYTTAFFPAPKLTPIDDRTSEEHDATKARRCTVSFSMHLIPTYGTTLRCDRRGRRRGCGL